jgi:anti-sigma regulatory factor (Ser/Thr protein kinase)
MRPREAVEDQEIGHSDECFRHETLFYAGEDGFLEGTLPFLRDAVAAEEPTLVAVGDAQIKLLTEALGDDAKQVLFTDMRVLGGNPARIIPAWHQFLEDQAPDGRPVRGIGEPIWPGRSPEELSECQRHEALLNLAFDGGQAWRLLCPYDLNGLDEEVIEAAMLSHPFIARDGVSIRSEGYMRSHLASDPFSGTLPAPSAPTSELSFTSQDLGALRKFVATQAKLARVEEDRIEDLVLAVNELAANSVLHGGGGGTLRIWREQDRLLCEVRDSGYIEAPLTGRVRPEPDQRTGRGLWLANQICDLVQIRSSPAGNVVRAHLRLI